MGAHEKVHKPVLLRTLTAIVLAMVVFTSGCALVLKRVEAVGNDCYHALVE